MLLKLIDFSWSIVFAFSRRCADKPFLLRHLDVRGQEDQTAGWKPVENTRGTSEG
jgi:hypothetical protein